jgi:hypothetical protein
MPLQCTTRPSSKEVITRSPGTEQPEAPRHEVASDFPSWSSKSRSCSSVEQDPETPASRRLVAGLHEPSCDRPCGSLDWNKSKPGKVVATPEEVEPGADSIPICAAEVWSGKLSSSSTNLLRSLRGSVAKVFGLMSMRNRRKLPAPSAMQTHEPKTKVVP